LALQTVRAAGFSPPSWGVEKFRLHYYGHTLDAKGNSTYPTIPAAEVFDAALDPEHPQQHNIDPTIFKDKIVLFGTSAVGAFDLKSSPLDSIYPGVEIHATAIENLLKNQRVTIVPGEVLAAITILVAGAASIGATVPRRTWMKLLVSGLVAVILLIVAGLLFRRENIIWLPPLGPLAAIGISVVLALSWSYFAEDRQARFYLRALGQYVSPQVAAELKADKRKLDISSTKGELTILFSDIVSFTNLSERLEERIGPVLNYYLDEMSIPVWAQNGTIDKYIGDAIMTFWNAPVPQPDHAIRACRAALAMHRRLREIEPDLAKLEAPGLRARIGINSGVCTYGNMGSRAKINYSVIGDPCNFASRLEGANKIYGTSILIGEATRNLVRDHFVLRKTDLLRVMGKQKPQAIYELMAEGAPDPVTAKRIGDYEAAFSHYCQGEWEKAEKILLDVLAAFPDDGPSRELLSRVAAFQQRPPTAPWDGVFSAKGK
jgi:adenylate cyclase